MVPETLAVWPRGAPAESRQARWLGRGLRVVGVCVFLGCLGFGLLALADFSTAGNGSRDARARAAWTLARGDHLHFAVHIVTGRLLDICPCTRRAAGAQYYRAHFHAVTPLQRDVAADTHPKTLGDWFTYVVGPAQVGAAWVGDGLGWLGGSRPARQVTANLNRYAIQPGVVERREPGRA